MTETAAPTSAPPAGPPDAHAPAADRGTTQFSSQVVEKLAVRLATEVTGVVDRPLTGLRSALPGGASTSTSAHAEVGRSSANVALQLDVGYPSPICEVVEQVRVHVREGLERLTGLQAGRLDVTVRHVVLDPAAGARVN